MMKVYGDLYSGNCYKLRLLMRQLDLEHEWVPIDLARRENRTPEFLTKNPNAKIPLLELPDGSCLPESNAILHYLAEGTDLLPRDRLQHAQVLQWLFFEQYSHEPYIAVARYLIRFLGRPAEHEALLASKMKPGYRALDVMEQHLASRRFFVAERYTIADVGLYAYTHVAHEGDFDLAGYPAIQAWLARVAEQPGYVPMGV